MLFTGHSEHTIDAKQRLAVPAKYRNQWDAARDGSCWVAVPWPDGTLRLYTENKFNELANQSPDSMTPSEQVNIGLRPAEGQETIDVTIVGKRNRLEIIDRATYNATKLERFRNLPAAVAALDATKNGASPA